MADNAQRDAFNDIVGIVRDIPIPAPSMVCVAVFTSKLASAVASGELSENPVSAITGASISSILPTLIIDLFAPQFTKPGITGILYGISAYKVGRALYDKLNEPEIVKTWHTIEVDGKKFTVTYHEPVKSGKSTQWSNPIVDVNTAPESVV